MRMSRIIYGISIFSLCIGFLWLLLIIAAWIVDGWLFVEGLIKVQVPIFLWGNVPIVMLAFPQLRQYTMVRQ